MQVGRKICRLRMDQGMTQEILAGRADLTQANLSLIENGKSEAGLLTLHALAKALGITLEGLMSGVE